MPAQIAKMELWLENLLGAHPRITRRPLEEFLESLPGLGTLADLPSGTPVLVRGDLDCKPGASVGEGDVRLRSMLDTLRHGQKHGWKQVILGHIGRDPQASLSKVHLRLQELLECDVAFVPDWLDDSSNTVTDAAAAAVENCPDGGFVLLENTRKYAIERALWKAQPEDAKQLAESLATLAASMADRLAKTFVNEAFAAGSLDASSTVIPFAMQQVALGKYVASEFRGPLLRCRNATLVAFSGLKADKLDDLEAIIDRGRVRMVIAAGSLAMALATAAARLDGKTFSTGIAEDSAHADKPYFIPPARIEQAERMIAAGRENNVEFVLPVDFVLADGTVAAAIPPDGQQLDVGPASRDLFGLKVGEFLASDAEKVVFHNGVFGKFEDPAFEEGTRQFIGQLKRMKNAGVEVYVGGGEGGAALEKYGQPDWVTHCFTAGGTVLAALGNEPIPYLLALWLAMSR